MGSRAVWPSLAALSFASGPTARRRTAWPGLRSSRWRLRACLPARAAGLAGRRPSAGAGAVPADAAGHAFQAGLLQRDEAVEQRLLGGARAPRREKKKYIFNYILKYSSPARLPGACGSPGLCLGHRSASEQRDHQGFFHASVSSVGGSSPASGLASFSAMRCKPMSLVPLSSAIRVTPCVARPSSRISPTRVRTSTPPVGDQHDLVGRAHQRGRHHLAVALGLVWIAIMPLVPRPWRVYSTMRRALAVAVLGGGAARSAYSSSRHAACAMHALAFFEVHAAHAAGLAAHRAHVVLVEAHGLAGVARTASRRACRRSGRRRSGSRPRRGRPR